MCMLWSREKLANGLFPVPAITSGIGQVLVDPIMRLGHCLCPQKGSLPLEDRLFASFSLWLQMPPERSIRNPA